MKEKGKGTGEVGINQKPDEEKTKLRRLEIHTVPGTVELHEGQIDWPVIRAEKEEVSKLRQETRP